MRRLLSFITIGLLLVACYNAPQGIRRLTAAGSEASDSATAQWPRPYGVGFNFVVHADSLLLQEERPMHWCQGVAETSDSLWVRRNDPLVVAAITVIPEDGVDSVWVKLARDQFTMGWTHEHDLLQAASPDDPISRFINVFSDHHVLWCLVIVAVVLLTLVVVVWHRHSLRMVLVDDIPSVYPTLLTITLVCAAWLYAYIQHFVPQLWVQFYFHPTLNPLSQPPVLCAFLFAVWALVLLSLVTVEVALEMLPALDALLYLLSLLGISAACYMLVSITAWSWMCHLACAAYILVALYRYFRYNRARYYCGNCHRKLQHKGACPYCGVIND